jgi:hypothetical protein
VYSLRLSTRACTLQLLRTRACRYEGEGEPQTVPALPGPPADWGTIIPNHGTLYFDYLSYKRAPADAQAVSQEELAGVLVACGIKLIAETPQLPAGAPLPRCR